MYHVKFVYLSLVLALSPISTLFVSGCEWKVQIPPFLPPSTPLTFSPLLRLSILRLRDLELEGLGGE